jgi:hypothetical protein
LLRGRQAGWWAALDSPEASAVHAEFLKIVDAWAGSKKMTRAQGRALTDAGILAAILGTKTVRTAAAKGEK